MRSSSASTTHLYYVRIIAIIITFKRSKRISFIDNPVKVLFLTQSRNCITTNFSNGMKLPARTYSPTIYITKEDD